VISRRAGRVLVIDAGGRVLLLHGFDPARPREPYWFTIGGGAEPGESLAQAAARELSEETGISADAAELGEPVWHEVSEFSFDGTSYRQEQDFFELRIGSAVVMYATGLGPVTITPDKPGTFVFFCDVFCGDGHEEMAGTLVVEA